MLLTALALRQHRAGGHIQGGEQGRGAVTHVIEGHPLDITQSHRQYRLGALQRLDLTLLIHAQHDGMVGRVEVELDNVAYLLDEERVVGELELALAVR